MSRYRRVLVKLSGGAFSGQSDFGFDQGALEHIADEVLALQRLGVEVGIMVGGGNIFRGRMGELWGIERVEADNIGTMATVVNSLILRGVLTARGSGEVRVMTAMPIPSVAEPYIRLRAIHHLEKGYLVIFAGGTGQPFQSTDYPSVQRALEVRADALLAAKDGVSGIYTADPKVDPAARRYRSVDYDTALREGLQVMDQSAFILARDYSLPVHCFGFTDKGSMTRICHGEDVGTYIARGVPTQLV